MPKASMFSPDTPPALARALAARGYEAATPVQAAVSAPEHAERDLLVTAKTGSGKTVAYGLALAPTLLADAERLPPAAAPLALVIAPTRELALQVREELAWLYAEAGARVVACVGGMDPRREARELQHGVHIVVGTPGRLRDHLERGQLDLSALRAAVLDEADEMLDMGFREELEEILNATPAERRTLLFSATLPREIEHLARSYQRDALRLTVDAGGEAHADIAYQAVPIAPYEVERAVVNILRWREAATAIVFCSTREAVNRLHANLVERGFGAVALSGELTQAERTRALQALRDRRARVCVATDVAARGIDIPDLELVVHADLPHDSEVLLHRSGRTGRAGRKGVCAILVPHPKRRRAEQLIRGARIQVEWTPAPSADSIRERDALCLVEEVAPAQEDELAAARTLLAERSAEDVAAALVRLHRARLPSPEDLAEASPEPPVRAPRQGFEGSVWFRIDLGRNRNADPRWLLPLICRRGHVTKGEIGAIRVFDRESRFEIVAAAADRFRHALAQTASDDEVRITAMDEAPPLPPRERRGPPKRAGNDGHPGPHAGQGWSPQADAVSAGPGERPRGPRPPGGPKPYGKPPGGPGAPKPGFSKPWGGKPAGRAAGFKRGPQRRG